MDDDWADATDAEGEPGAGALQPPPPPPADADAKPPGAGKIEEALDDALDPLEGAADDEGRHGIVDAPTFDDADDADKEIVAVLHPGEAPAGGADGAPDASGEPARLIDADDNLYVLARPAGLVKQLVFYEDRRLLMDLVTLLTATGVGALAATALRQPVIIAYLLAGMVVRRDGGGDRCPGPTPGPGAPAPRHGLALSPARPPPLPPPRRWARGGWG